MVSAGKKEISECSVFPVGFESLVVVWERMEPVAEEICFLRSEIQWDGPTID